MGGFILDGSLDRDYDLGNQGENVGFHTIELIEHCPGPTRGETFEEAADSSVFVVCRAVQDEAELGYLSA